jgi:hypothetical protein
MSGQGQIPSYTDLSAFNVNRDGWEAIKQSLYDTAAYPAAGINQLSFFTLPVGQGVSVLGTPAAKSLSDTNMTLAGQMPANQEFLIQSVEVVFLPTTPTVAAAMPAFFGTDAISGLVNDAYIFYRSGNLNLNIGSKSYLQEANLMRFPPKAYFDIAAAVESATTAAASLQSRIAFATARGRPYLLQPANLRLVSNQNFSVTLNWPEGLQAILQPAEVRVILDGILYRRSQ